ncbi:hypothetical protein [Spinactinospora alkalitolerans]|nr:hypothetical protein [Spinactinospora alkalitolerans]
MVFAAPGAQGPSKGVVDALDHAVALRAGIRAQGGNAAVVLAALIEAEGSPGGEGADGWVCEHPVADQVLLVRATPDTPVDSLRAARTLTRLARRVRPDVVLCAAGSDGREAVELAARASELALLPAATSVVRLAPEQRSLVALREVEHGWQEMRVDLPCVIGVSRGPDPRPDPEGRNDAEVRVLDAAELLGSDRPGSARGTAESPPPSRILHSSSAPTPRAGMRTGDPRTAVRHLAAAQARTSPLPRPRRPIGARRQVWVPVQYRDGLCHPASLEGLDLAARLHPALAAVAVVPCAAPEQARALAPELGRCGAEQVLALVADGLESRSPAGYARALSCAAAEEAPLAVIGAGTADGREYLARLAVRLNTDLIGDVVNARVDAPPQAGPAAFVWTRAAGADREHLHLVTRAACAVAALRPGCRPHPRSPSEPAPPELRMLRPGIGVPDGRITELDRWEDRLARRHVEQAAVVVHLGAGVSADTAEAAHRIADARGWTVGGSPQAVQAGLVPPQMEISVERLCVFPSVALCLGAEPRDLDAVQGAGLVIAVPAFSGRGRAVPGADLTVDTDADRVLRTLSTDRPPSPVRPGTQAATDSANH